MRKILVSNDDGIFSDGIIRLARLAKDYGDVWVVAPESQRSGYSHSITLRKPIDVWKVDFPVEGVEAYACSGTPADCIRLGVLNIMPEKPDLLLAGINDGYNVGTDIQYSATAGCAFEGCFQKVHTIAFSEDNDGPHDVTDTYIRPILEELMEKSAGINRVWNVNFPACPLEDYKGILYNRAVSLVDYYHDCYDGEPLEGGIIRFNVRGNRNDEGPEGTDIEAVLNNYISIGTVTNFQ